MESLSDRDKLILAGLFLSKFDKIGLNALGFDGFTEAFNAIAFALNGVPAALKNYRDEFDPFFPNPRKGWHKRPLRKNCKKIMDRFAGMELTNFAKLIKSEISNLGDIELIKEQVDEDAPTSFAKRLVTGQAAENYFEKVYSGLPEFRHRDLTNTTQLGCGFDFKMVRPEHPFLAVEVKGMALSNGPVQLTSKEYMAAQVLADQFFLFVVRNFNETPFHSIYQNPLNSDLVFSRRETKPVQVTWVTNVRS